MVSRKVIFWEVDTQKDFMLPGGKLYVLGAEELLPNLRKLTQAARDGRVFLASDGCVHTPDDPEFTRFPPHCIEGTEGAEYVPEALADKVYRVPNEPTATLPPDPFQYQQILLEKQTLDVFESRHADAFLQLLPRDARFIVFGVVTEYCVGLVAKGLLQRGRKVSVVRDAIETLNPADGEKMVAELTRLGANFITTMEALKLLDL
jgi:nicotinamidase/pyrazinamidase